MHRPLQLLLAIAATAIALVQAGAVHDPALAARHVHIAARRSENTNPLARSVAKRCANRPSVVQTTRTSSPSSSASPSSSSAAATPSPPPSDPGSGDGSTISGVSGPCGNPGATTDITATSGPNGNIEWLNCGIDGGGWTPANVAISDLIVKDLGQALNDPNSPFQGCSPFIWAFEQYGNQFGIPPIMLAAFAMQESSCQPNMVGGAGEQGLMQLTVDKCGGAPGGNCQDPAFNIYTGAQYFKQTLDQVGGNVLLAIGTYNGWHLGLTYDEATAAAYTGCCKCQNNLDYLHQFLNGWVQNVDARAHNPALGLYFNLAVCG